MELPQFSLSQNSRLIKIIQTPSVYLPIYVTFVASAVILLGYTGRDDSHITYFVSDMLAKGHGIVNYSGAPIEQSSSLLYTATLALPIYLINGLRAADIGPLASFFFYLLLVMLLAAHLRSYVANRAAALAITTNAPLVYWALSGMEVTMYACLLVALAMIYTKPGRRNFIQLLAMAALSALAALVRPEGGIVVICAVAGTEILLLYFRLGFQASKPICVLGGVVVAGLFRLLIGLQIFPNTVYAKENIPLLHKIISGFHYLFLFAIDLPLSTGAAVVAFVASFLAFNDLDKERQPIVAFSLAAVIAILSFSVLSGGDWMEGGRFLVPAFVFSYLAMAVCLKSREKLFAMCGVLLFVSLLDIAYLARQSYGGIPLTTQIHFQTQNFNPSIWERHSRIHARDISFIDKMLGVLKRDDRTTIAIASDQAGMVAYYIVESGIKNVEFIDLKGLASNQTHKCLSWKESAYSDWEKTKKCVDEPIDYIFNLDSGTYDTAKRLAQEANCRILIEDDTAFTKPTWKKPLLGHQYLVRCD